MRVILIASHASIDFGGEAALPCHYFRVLKAKGIDVHLVVHDRSRGFLQKYILDSEDRIHYLPDRPSHIYLSRLLSILPQRAGIFSIGFVLEIITKLALKKIAKGLVASDKKTIIHEVIPVSPKLPSVIFDMNAPVVIGPLNGGMEYPKAFGYLQNVFVRSLYMLGRQFSFLAWYLLPGKLKADAILVANKRSENALPVKTKGRIYEIVENGVDLSTWKVPEDKTFSKETKRFVYIGRLVDWKAVDIVIEALSLACVNQPNLELAIIGDGPERENLEQKVNNEFEISENVQFHGWMDQHEIAPILNNSTALLLSSLYECGGAVVLEAMACSIPVVATNWGGPSDYLDDSCGILVEPKSRTFMLDGFKNAILRLSENPALVETMGANGRRKIEQQYDWEIKGEKIIKIYEEILSVNPTP